MLQYKISRVIILTNFTISVEFLYGVILCEPYTTHPLNAFGSCHSCQLQIITCLENHLCSYLYMYLHLRIVIPLMYLHNEYTGTLVWGYTCSSICI